MVWRQGPERLLSSRARANTHRARGTRRGVFTKNVACTAKNGILHIFLRSIGQ